MPTAALPIHMSSIYDFSALQMNGQPLPLKRFKGHVMLIVNTASQCGFTGQFAGQQTLHQNFSDKGAVRADGTAAKPDGRYRGCAFV